jgi:hypothetical protein
MRLADHSTKPEIPTSDRDLFWFKVTARLVVFLVRSARYLPQSILQCLEVDLAAHAIVA